jgi:hypothetical protein
LPSLLSVGIALPQGHPTPGLLLLPSCTIISTKEGPPPLGVSGPCNLDVWRRTPLAGLDYDEGELRAWAEERLAEFDLTG